MNAPIQPAAPVNPTVTIQPVTAAPVTNEGGGHQQNPLANLASGTTVEGFVVNRDAQNNPIVRTAIGDLRVTSEVFLKTGSEVIFKVDASQASLARIISVDGMTPQDYSAKQTHGITRDTISTTLLQQTTAQTPMLTGKAAGQPPAPVLQALILQGTPAEPAVAAALKASLSGPIPLLAQLAQLRSGTPVRLSVLDLKLPPIPVSVSALPENHQLDTLLPPRPTPTFVNMATPQSPTPLANQTPPVTKSIPAQPILPNPSVPAPMTPSQPAQRNTAAQQPLPTPPIPLPSADATTPFKPTAQQEVRAFVTPAVPDKPADHPAFKAELVAHYGKAASSVPVAPPASNAAAPTTQQAPLRPSGDPTTTTYPLTASVIGHEADGANILHTPFATLKLYTSQPLPTGTTLVVQATHDEQAATTAPIAQAVAEESFTSETMRPLKSLEEIITFFQQTNTEAAREVAQRLPTANHTLTSGLLFFMSALKAGNAEEMLGKRALRMLELSTPNLLAKFRKDISQLQANWMDSPLSNWSVAQLPLMFGHELQHARLFISKDPEKESASAPRDAHGQRFVLEVGMSQLGPMQLDGFVRNHEKTKNFDLVVRSAQTLDTEMTQGIGAIFYASMEAAGMHGQIIFQAGPQHFVKPALEEKSVLSAQNPNTILA